MICGGAGPRIEAAHGAAELASGWLSQPALKAAVLMYKAAAEGGGKLGVKKRRERGVKPPYRDV
jgi:hypothetical protein